jgi:tripartite-type tricarboxylate transporter receptor subunit TctC
MCALPKPPNVWPRAAEPDFVHSPSKESIMSAIASLHRRVRRLCLVVPLIALTGAGAAMAQAFPSKPITLIVPFAAGSPTDMAARAFADDLGPALNTPVLVDNRPGAAQSIAGAMVARAPADGYTLLFANLPAIVPPSIQAKLPYAGIRDFAPVANVMSFGFVLFTSPNVPARNLQEFVALLKADPNKYAFGSGGVASPPHVIGEMFNGQIGVKTVHVPFRGANQVLLELVADRVSYAFLPTGGMEFVKSGKLKALGVASDKRDADHADLPTMNEAGVRGFVARARFVLVAPKQTPADVIAKLNAASNKVLSGTTFYGKVKSIGGVEVPAPATPAQVGALIADDEARWDGVVKKAGIVLE